IFTYLDGHEVVSQMEVAINETSADERLANDRRVRIVGEELQDSTSQAGGAGVEIYRHGEGFARLQRDRTGNDNREIAVAHAGNHARIGDCDRLHAEVREEGGPVV